MRRLKKGRQKPGEPTSRPEESRANAILRMMGISPEPVTDPDAIDDDAPESTADELADDDDADADVETEPTEPTPPPERLAIRKPIQIDGTFDIECADWNRFALGVCYDGFRAKVFYDVDQMIDHMRARGGTWWAHAGGIYDMLLMLERARVRGIPCQIDRAQQRVSRIVMGALTLRDSYGVWPVPLDEICGFIGKPVPALPSSWRCLCGVGAVDDSKSDDRKKDAKGTRDAQGARRSAERSEVKKKRRRRPCVGRYCQIGPRAAAGDPDLEDYCVADCERLHEGLCKLRDVTASHRVHLAGTLGQTAWLAAQEELGIPDSDIPWSIWRHARRADRGGRVAIVRPRAAGPGRHHDICNAYPAQLARAELPVGDVRELGQRDAMLALKNLAPGMYQCTVNVPDTLFLPPLPWLRGKQMWFPTGNFTGTWTLPELVCAFERGVSLDGVHTALVWEGTAPIFAPFVERLYAIRRETGRKTPFGQWIGKLCKAVAGKLAERPERQRVTMHPASIKVCTRKGPCRHECTGRCGAYEQLDLAGEIWAIPYARIGPSAYPQWSSYLRALTRIQWLEQAERFSGDLCLGNTDSLWTIGRGAPDPLGDGLGQWEYQHAWADLDVRSANTYAFRELAEFPPLDPVASRREGRAVYHKAEGVQHVRGVPGITPDDWKRGAGIIDRGIVTFGAAVRSAGKDPDERTHGADGETPTEGARRRTKDRETERGLFTRRRRRWSLPGERGERVWYGDRKLASNGITFPPDVEEIREMLAERERSAREG